MNFLNPPGGLSSVKRIIDTEVIPVLEHRLKRKFDPTEVERLLRSPETYQIPISVISKYGSFCYET